MPSDESATYPIYLGHTRVCTQVRAQVSLAIDENRLPRRLLCGEASRFCGDLWGMDRWGDRTLRMFRLLYYWDAWVLKGMAFRYSADGAGLIEMEI